jgi:hypothetical protein
MRSSASRAPDKITIYRRRLERLYGADPIRLRREIRRVVLHEVARHFGISDRLPYRWHELRELAHEYKHVAAALGCMEAAGDRRHPRLAGRGRADRGPTCRKRRSPRSEALVEQHASWLSGSRTDADDGQAALAPSPLRVRQMRPNSRSAHARQ